MDVEQSLQKALNDTRSPDELFESMKQKIIASADYEMTEKEAIDATRNFIQFCKSITGLGTKNKDNNLEKQNIES